MRKIVLALTLFAVVLTTGCRTDKSLSEPQFSAAQSEISQAKGNNMYIFKACSPDLLPSGTSKIRGLYDDKPAEYHSLFIGQVLSRFGEPDYITEDNENLFSKVVSAEDKDGNVLYLEIYYGPSGPAIGGDNSERMDETRKAADELADYIIGAEPVDFEYKSVYGDLDMTLTMGSANGKPYYISDFTDGFF